MTSRALVLVALLAALAGCAVQERESRVDVSDALKADMRACGTDTDCLRKRAAARNRGAPSKEAKPASP